MYEKIALLFMGGIIAYVFQQYRSVTSEEVAKINEHIKELEQYTNYSIQYWSTDYEKFDDNIIMSNKILTTHEILLIQYQNVQAYCSNINYDYRHLFKTLYRATTGENFNSQDKTIEPEKISQILEASHDLIQLLRNERIYMISLSRFFIRFLLRLARPYDTPWLRHFN